MATKRHKPEEIVTKLRQVEVLVGQGMARIDAIREIGIGLPKSGGPVSVLVHSGFLSYGRSSGRSGSGRRSRPLHWPAP